MEVVDRSLVHYLCSYVTIIKTNIGIDLVKIQTDFDRIRIVREI